MVERRAKEPGASLYLVTTPAGEHIVGNVSRVPVGVLSSPGQYEGPYGRGSESDQAEHRAIMRVYTLAGGFRLLVGRDTEERDRLRDAIGNTFGSSLALVLVLGVVGGWFVASRVLKRVDDMTETTRCIMAGDLDGRLKVSGSGDELDRLALNLNLMLERIGELMRGMREVSDNIAHDLKTPLTRLRNRADEALRTAQTPDDLRAAIEGIVEDGDGLIRVFNALLTIARLEAGSAPDTAGIGFDAGEVAGEMAELYEALAEERGLHLGFSREPNLPLRGNRELVWSGARQPHRQRHQVRRGGLARDHGRGAARRGQRDPAGRRPRPRRTGSRAGPRARPVRAPRRRPHPARLRTGTQPRQCGGAPSRRQPEPRRQRAGLIVTLTLPAAGH